MNNIQKANSLHPLIRAEVMPLIAKANKELTCHSEVIIVQALRTFEEQNALYAQRPKVTNAKGGQSFHNYGLAIDFALLINGTTISWDSNKDFDGDKVADWMEVVKVFKNAGWEWGGNWNSFKDLPHLQKVFLHTWKELLIQYNNGDFIDGTKYVKLNVGNMQPLPIKNKLTLYDINTGGKV